jgi:hypothetical protein
VRHSSPVYGGGGGGGPPPPARRVVAPSTTLRVVPLPHFMGEELPPQPSTRVLAATPLLIAQIAAWVRLVTPIFFMMLLR